MPLNKNLLITSGAYVSVIHSLFHCIPAVLVCMLVVVCYQNKHVHSVVQACSDSQVLCAYSDCVVVLHSNCSCCIAYCFK
jgi:hypothetical protein